MILPVDIQLYYFLTTITAGFIVGLMFDVYRIIRGFNAPKKVLTRISDLLFWILAAIVVFIFFLYSNNVYLRYNSFIGLFLGNYIYFKFISRAIIKFLKWTTFYIIKFFRVLMLFILYPIKLLRYGISFVFLRIRESAKIKFKKPKKKK